MRCTKQPVEELSYMLLLCTTFFATWKLMLHVRLMLFFSRSPACVAATAVDMSHPRMVVRAVLQVRKGPHRISHMGGAMGPASLQALSSKQQASIAHGEASIKQHSEIGF